MMVLIPSMVVLVAGFQDFGHYRHQVVVSSARESLPLFSLEALVPFGWEIPQSINIIQPSLFVFSGSDGLVSIEYGFHSHILNC
ncbi:uncharacterized protein LOC141619262 isoform X2 [Silene latifolia]|uniref:uncharacterized protein LOC141619262 isoform X2 n=1 Tax=Silene latifolia TaxID=37657 RepID=UPI003D773456